MSEQSSSIYHHYIAELELNSDVFRFMLNSGMNEEICLWKPEPGVKNIFEILSFLIQVEKNDFREKIRVLLEGNNEEIIETISEISIPQSQQNRAIFAEMLKEFLSERDKSILSLKKIKQTEWKKNLKHNQLGIVSPEVILTNWLSNDYQCIRQILKLKFEYIKF